MVGFSLFICVGCFQDCSKELSIVEHKGFVLFLSINLKFTVALMFVAYRHEVLSLEELF